MFFFPLCLFCKTNFFLRAHLRLVVLEVHMVLVSVLVGEWDQGDDLWSHQCPFSQNFCHNLTTKV